MATAVYNVNDTHVKDPNEVLDYVFDWNGGHPGPWLATGDAVTSYTVTVESGLTKDSDSEYEADAIRVWLSGGTLNEDYTVTCQVVTNQGRTAERSIIIQVRDR